VELESKRRKQEAREKTKTEKKKKKWEEFGYHSCAVDLDEDASVPRVNEEDILVGLNEEDERDIQYVVGDVTQPHVDPSENAIILICMDNSGGWGKGGMFSAVSSLSPMPKKVYTTAYDMADLSVGDVHLVDVSDNTTRF